MELNIEKIINDALLFKGKVNPNIETYLDAQKAFDNAWSKICLVYNLDWCNPKVFTPSILPYVKISERRKSFLLRLLSFILTIEDKPHVRIDIKGIISMICEISKIQMKDKTGEGKADKRVSLLLDLTHRVLHYMKKNTDKDNTQIVEKLIANNLPRVGVKVVEYDGTNEELFQIEIDSTVNGVEVVSPTLIDIKTGEIINEGVIFKSDK